MATLYVNGSTGDDSRTYAQAQNSATPWQTIGRAAWGDETRSTPNASEAAAAGDTVIIAAGTYSSSAVVNSQFNPLYNPVNSGSSGSPITFQASGTVVLQATTTNSPVIGSYQKNYITWSGAFVLDEAVIDAAVDTGVAVIWEGTGCVIEGVEIDGNGDPGWSDNHTGIAVRGGVTNSTIRNCTIHDVRSDGGNNGAGIQVYNGQSLTIEHNLIYNVGSGVFFKDIGAGGSGGSPATATSHVRYNVIHSAGSAVDMHRVQFNGTFYVLIYQNIIYSSTQGLLLHSFPGDGPTNIRFVNNTVDDCTRGLVMTAMPFEAAAGNLLQNNIFSNSSTYVYFEEDPTVETFDDTTVLLAVRNFSYVHTTNYAYTYDEGSASAKNFAAFQSAHSGQEVDGSDGTDPVYANQAGRDYHISGAAALVAGRVVHSIGGTNGDTIPVGAYITGSETIGVESSVSSVVMFI